MDRSRLPSSSMSNDLCNDIIIEILSWLPVDSLLRFKFVSKSWFSLIINPNFSKLHLDHHHHNHHSLSAAATQTYNPTNVMFISGKNYCMKSMDEVIVSLSSSSSSSSSSIIEEHDMVNSFDFTQHSSIRIVGSCNGLICFVAYDDSDESNTIFCLWNPSTKEVKQLPTYGDGVIVDLEYYHYYHDLMGTIAQRVWYGFGYDHVTDDYKVLLASAQYFNGGDFPNNYDDNGFCESEIKVYSLRTNTWRRIRGKPYNSETVYVKYNSTRMIPGSCTYVSGAFHRVALSSLNYRIVSFDIVDEVDREVPTPEGLYYSGSHDQWYLNLIVLRGCLCVSVNVGAREATDEYMEVWMMKDYGAKESWTKLVSITNTDFNIMKWFKPVWFHKNGEVVMVGNSELVIYDPKHDQVKWLEPWPSWNVGEDYLQFATEIYIGSLVSMKSYYEGEIKEPNLANKLTPDVRLVATETTRAN